MSPSRTGANGKLVEADLAPPVGIRLGLDVVRQPSLLDDQPVRRNGGECLGGRLDPEPSGQFAGHRPCRCGGQHLMPGATLGDGPAEAARRSGHRQEGHHRHGPGGHAEHGDVVRVPAEGPDVRLDPVERGELVEDPPVRRAVVQEEEALAPEPVVEGHADHAVAGEAVAVVPGDAARPVPEGAAVDPHHDRQSRRTRVRGPHVEVQAVLPGNLDVRQQCIERWWRTTGSERWARTPWRRGSRPTGSVAPGHAAGRRRTVVRRRGSRGRRRLRRCDGPARSHWWWRPRRPSMPPSGVVCARTVDRERYPADGHEARPARPLRLPTRPAPPARWPAVPPGPAGSGDRSPGRVAFARDAARGQSRGPDERGAWTWPSR